MGVTKPQRDANYKFQGAGYETNAFDKEFTSRPVVIPIDGATGDFEIVTLDGETHVVPAAELAKHFQMIKEIKSANTTAALTDFYLVK